MDNNDDKKLKNSPNNDGENQGNSTNPNKQPEKITLINNESVHNQPIDVNQNVGSFSPDTIDPSKQQKEQTPEQLDVSDQSQKFVNIKNKDVAINFEKFEKTKRSQKQISRPGNSKFSIKFDAWLHNRKPCLIIWMAALGTIIVLLALSISLVVVTTLDKKTGGGYWDFTWMKNLQIASAVFSYVIMALTVIPLIYLLITVLVGIRDTYRSLKFHYFMWGCFIAAFVLLIAMLVMSGIEIHYNNVFTKP